MKRQIPLFLATLFLAAAAISPAQGQTDRGQFSGAIVEALGLTENQVAQLRVLRAAQREQRQAAMEVFRANTAVQRDELETEICELRAQREQALGEILTPEQRQDLALIEAIRKERRDNRRRGAREPIAC